MNNFIPFPDSKNLHFIPVGCFIKLFPSEQFDSKEYNVYLSINVSLSISFFRKKKRPSFVTRVNLSKSEFIIDILFEYSSLPSNLIYIPQIVVFEESV